MEKKSTIVQLKDKRNGRRVILFPLPIQGCINPMLQLAKILYSRGFSITVIHTRFNAPKPSNHPLFSFLEIPDGLSESQASTQNVPKLLALLNGGCESIFKESLAKLLQSDYSETVACLISDNGWLFAESVAESLKLPRIVLNTYKASFCLAHTIIPDLRRKGYLPVPDSEADSPILELPPLRKKDLPWLLVEDGKLQDPHLSSMVKTIKASSGLILMSCEELEQDSLIRAREVFQVPIFPIGPFHSYFLASSSSLFAQDETCIPWLDKQEDKSVIYVSFGSISTISESEFLEITWGLCNSNQPFVWAIRPNFVHSSQWTDLLPKEYFERLNGRGKIAKWAPQQDILAHRATGGFLTHSGWNSILESICEGIPMICHPCRWDQMLNARYVSEVWRVGLQLEGRFERVEIENTIRRLMVESEGQEIRERVKLLKEKIEMSLKEGGSSHRSLKNLVDHLLSF